MTSAVVRGIASSLNKRGLRSMSAAYFHVNAASLAKREDKWKSNVYGYMDGDAVRKRHTTYEKRLRRAEAKRKIHREWRCLQLDGDEMKVLLEQKHQYSEPPDANGSTKGSWWSQRLEKDWKRFCQKRKGRQRDPPEAQTNYGTGGEADPFSENGTDTDCSGKPSSSGRGGSYWSSTAWENYARRGTSWTSWGTQGPECSDSKQACSRKCSPADRAELGLAPTGPLTAEVVKNAFRQCALKWHPDRHLGASKVGCCQCFFYWRWSCSQANENSSPVSSFLMGPTQRLATFVRAVGRV